MTTKHTPGPWRAKLSDNYPERVVWEPTKGDEAYVAICRYENGGLFEGMENTAEAEANAKLIAAAPENIELDIELIEKWLTFITERLTKSDREKFENWIQRKKAAIKKATE